VQQLRTGEGGIRDHGKVKAKHAYARSQGHARSDDRIEPKTDAHTSHRSHPPDVPPQLSSESMTLTRSGARRTFKAR